MVPSGIVTATNPFATAAFTRLAAAADVADASTTILPQLPDGGMSSRSIPGPTAAIMAATVRRATSVTSVSAVHSAANTMTTVTGVGVVVVIVEVVVVADVVVVFVAVAVVVDMVVVVVFVYEVVVVVTVVVVVSVVVVFVTVELVTVELVTVEEVTVEEVTVVHLPATAWFSSDIALYPFVSVRSVEAPIKDWLYVRTPLYVDESNPLVGFPPKNFHCGSASVLLLI